ncbi:MAG: hypothetical protein ACQEXX_01930 [Bacillota bacterium]
MSKKLSTATINKLNKELAKKKKIYILGEHEVTIDLVFMESKIDKVIFDYLSLFEEASKGNAIDEDFIRGTGAILHTLILREFSDVPMIPKERNLKKIIKVTEVLYNTGIMEEVISSFATDEVKKVYNKLDQNSKRVGQILGEFAISSTLSQGVNEDDSSQESQGTGEDTKQED